MKETDPKHTLLTLDQVKEMATKTLLEYGQHAPTLLVEGTEQQVIVQVEPLAPTAEQRSQQFFLVGMAIAQQADVGVLQQAFFISEAWLSTANEGKLPAQTPSQDPERKEVLIIAQRQVVEEQDMLAVYEMLRNTDGQVIAVAEYPLGSEMQAESFLLNAFLHGFLSSFKPDN